MDGDEQSAMPIEVRIYTRENCHLCEEAKSTVESVVETVDRPVTIKEIDVDTEKRLREEYGERVPYVFVDGWPAFKYRVETDELRRQLTEA